MGLGEVLNEWLAHRQVVLVRRSRHRLARIRHRLEVLKGYLITYLNLDKVIRIIRNEDEPKPLLMKAFKLSDIQAEAILNMRLRSLRKLEEIEIRAEHDKLSKERREIKSLLKSDDQQWERIADEVKATREAYSRKTQLGRRRTTFADAPAIEFDLEQAMIEKDPITVILSEKGWIRAMRGHMDDLSKLEFKQGDGLLRAVKAYTTDKLLLLATNGKVFTLAGDQLPGGRGHGEPVRLMVDMEENHAFAEIFVHEPGRKLLVAATSGHGFVVPEDETVAMTRKGKQVMNLDEPFEACCCVPADGDMVAVIGENRKMLIFPLEEVNEMTRGKGVRLQRYKDGALSDVRVFRKADGLSWLDPAGRTFTLPMTELRDWLGERAQAGRLAPRGFPKSNKFGRFF
jgi:topoisomerase-4 subunit A